MMTQNPNPNQTLPESIRVRGQKGFYAHIDGKLELVNPGDVVEIPRALAFEMRAAGKAHMVSDPLKRQKDYVPEYAKAGKGAGDAMGRQLAALTETVAALVKTVTALAPQGTAKA